MPSGVNYGTVAFNKLGATGQFRSVEFWNGFSYYYGWTVSVQDGWVTITGVTDNGGHNGIDFSEGIHYNVAANTTGLARTTYFLFTVPGDPIRNGYVVVTQTGDPSYVFVPNSITLSSDAQIAGATHNIDTSQSPAEWYLYSPDLWIVLENGRESKIHYINSPVHFGDGSYPNPGTEGFSVTENTGTTVRMGTISLYDALFSRDWYNGVVPPSTPALATFYVNQNPKANTPAPVDGGGPGGGPVGATTFSGPFNLAQRDGFYCRCATGNDGNIYFWRANNTAPFGGFDVGPVIVSSSGVHDNSRLAYEAATKRLLCCFDRKRTAMPAGFDVYLATSDDDGKTWGNSKLILAGGTHPTIGVAIDHTVVIVAYQGPVGGPGTLQAVAQAPGEVSFSAPYTFQDSTGTALVAQDDTFHLVMPPNGSGLWVLVFRFGGDGGPSEWTSAEPNANSWTRVI